MSIAKCLQDLEAHGLANRGTELGALLQWAKLHMRDAADEIDRLRTEAVAADIRIANDALEIAELTKLAVSRYDEIANLIQQRDAALADAERYRWLRTYKPVSLLKLAPTQEPYLNAVDVVDTAIDKAMVEQP